MHDFAQVLEPREFLKRRVHILNLGVSQIHALFENIKGLLSQLHFIHQTGEMKINNLFVVGFDVQESGLEIAFHSLDIVLVSTEIREIICDRARGELNVPTN